MAGPYRAEFGAIYHEDAVGFLFTVTPAQHAEVVAEALNLADATTEHRPRLPSKPKVVSQ